MMKNRSGNRQIISFVMILIILVNSITSGYPVSAAEATVVAQGECGPSAEWILYSDAITGMLLKSHIISLPELSHSG